MLNPPQNEYMPLEVSNMAQYDARGQYYGAINSDIQQPTYYNPNTTQPEYYESSAPPIDIDPTAPPTNELKPTHSYDLLCLTLSVFLWISVGIFIYWGGENNGWWHTGGFFGLPPQQYFWIPIVILCITYIVYFIEAFCSSARDYSQNITDFSTARNYINAMVSAPPTINIKWQNYHYETRTHSYRDSDGNLRTETRTEEVVTSSGSTPVMYSSWKDLSEPLAYLDDDLKVVKMKSNIKLVCNGIKEVKILITSQNKRDQHIRSSIDFSINGLIKNLFVTNKRIACWGVSWFYMWTFIGLSWPYRIYCEMKTKGRVEFSFTKEAIL